MITLPYSRSLPASRGSRWSAAEPLPSGSSVDGVAQEPWVAADLTVLHEDARYVRFNVDLDVFPAVGTRDDEILLHAWHTGREPLP